jgi:predicted GNAT family N-acyltransferase
MFEACQVVTAEALHLPLELAEAITQLRLEAWPHIAGRPDATAQFLIDRWRDYAGSHEHRPLYHVALCNGELVAMANTFARTIASGDRRFTIMSLASVCTARRLRGRGYGRSVVRAAFERVVRDGFEFSLFQTTHAVEPFYAQLGAVKVDNRFYNSLSDDPDANPFWDPVPMRYPATGSWPTSPIDLLGPGY